MSRSRAWPSLLISGILAASLVACGDSGPPNPAPVASEPLPDAGGAGGSGGAPPAPIAKRTIDLRNPWGGPLGNLLVDGDFEFSVVVDGEQPQSGWYAFTASGNFGYLRGETGGLCRSGLRCGVLEANRLLWGQGTSAQDAPMVVSFWIKPAPERSCAAIVTAYALPCTMSSNLVWPIVAVADQPDADGWCEYRGTAPKRPSATCLYLESNLVGAETALLDAATLLPDEDTTANRSLAIPSAENAERIRTIRRKLRDRMPIGAPPAARLPIGAR